MSDLLRKFWSRAECEEPVFSAEEVEWVPPGQFALLCQLGFLKETSRATWARCEACGDGHVEEVVWIRNVTARNPTPFVPCPETGGAAVSLERLRRWAINLETIAQVLRRELGLIRDESVLVPGRVWLLGRRHVAGRYRDFFLVVGAAREDAHALWGRCRQIEQAPSPVILVPSQTPMGPPKVPAFRLADLAGMMEDRLAMDLDYLADALPREGSTTTAKTVASFPVPPDATWAELRLVVREHSIVAQLRNHRREFTFDDLGMSGPDDRLWRLLCLFASKGGRTPALGKSASNKQAATFRKQVSDLRRRLHAVFPIPSLPLQAVRGGGGYRCLFEISLDRRHRCPIQAECWEDLTFTELADRRIAISIDINETFATRVDSGEGAKGHHVAQDIGVRIEEFDLREFGLAEDSGTPTLEGILLLEFLRNCGKVVRRGDDNHVLRLAKRLRDWVGLETGPFQFSPSRKLWTATLTCRSNIVQQHLPMPQALTDHDLPPT